MRSLTMIEVDTITTKRMPMRELSSLEIDSVNGGGFWSDAWDWVTGGGKSCGGDHNQNNDQGNQGDHYTGVDQSHGNVNITNVTVNNYYAIPVSSTPASSTPSSGGGSSQGGGGGCGH
jgi:hypothetical protein